MERNDNIIVISADMGYGLLDDIKNYFPSRFFNVGSAEQLMIGAASGMAMEGKLPICYSITPFAIYRPFEFIRNLMNIEQLPIKIAGGGRDKDYGYLGHTHWAEEDLKVLSVLTNLSLYKPSELYSTEELNIVFKDCLYNNKPSYINLKK